jgi:EmrB/QacA subfamily drug resistance transporter
VATADAPAEARAPADGRRAELGRVLGAVALAMFICQLDFFSLNLAIPDMARDLGATTTDLQWAVSGYMLALGALLIMGGRIGDIYGRRLALLTGTAIFGVASLVAGAVDSVGLIIALRVVSGLGAAMMFPVAISIITNVFPEERRARAIGTAYGIAGLGTAVGPFVGGGLTEVSWRWVLWFNVPLCILVFVLALTSVPESRDESAPRKLDYPGLVAVSLGIALLSFTVDRGEAWGWTSAATIGGFVGGVLLLVAFVLIEKRVRFPLVDLKLFGNLPYVVVTLAGMVANLSFCVAVFCSTLYLQDVRGVDPLVAGVIFLAPSVCTMLAGFASGRLGDRRPSLVMGAALGVGGLFLLALAPVDDWVLYVPLFGLWALGLGLAWAYVSVGTQAVVQPERAGEASGVTLTIVVAVAGLGIAVAATVLEVLQADDESLRSAIETVMFAAGGLALAAGLVTLALPRVLGARAGRL